MKITNNKVVATTSVAILCLAIVFSAYMAFYAWVASNQTGAGAAQGDMGFYLGLRVITPVLLIVTGIPFIFGLYVRRDNMAVALNSWVSRLFYLNTVIVIWCWYYVFNLWY